MLINSVSFAQVNTCGSILRLNNYLKENQLAKEVRLTLEKETESYVSSKSINTTIPVVVHIIYKNTNENISDLQIQSQLDVLSADFTRTNTDASNTPVDFLTIIADMQIDFCLAKQKPDGSPTNGIIRKQTNNSFFPLYGNEIYYDSLGGSDAWDTHKYLNIWVCNVENGVLGWSQLPGGGDANTDGVIIDYEHFGTIGTAIYPYNLGRTTTHEVGHWFNLLHLWGDNTCGDDLVNDTPQQEEANFGCKIHPHQTCGNNGDMFMNFMDYTNDACMNSFTHGQKNRVWSAISNYRTGLLNSNGCSPSTIPNSDAGILTILEPNNENIICASPIYPKVVLKNYGNTILNSAIIKYSIDGSNDYFQNWNGTLYPLETDTILLSGITTSGTNHLLSVSSIYPNSTTDINPSNNEKIIIFSSINGKTIHLDLLTDNYGHETSWILTTDDNNIIDSGDSLSDNTLYKLSYCLDFGCYKFIINDSYGDGFCCNYGNGFYNIHEALSLNILASLNQFLLSDTASFCVGSTLNIVEKLNFEIFPNPTSGNIYLDDILISNNKPIFAKIFNMVGQLVYTSKINNNTLNISILNNGIYQLLIETTSDKYTRKIILQKN